MSKGTKVRVNTGHAGAAGSTGKVTSIERIQGRKYYNVKLTGGKARGWNMRFLKSELEVR